jgi:hypothetical protein
MGWAGWPKAMAVWITKEQEKTPQNSLGDFMLGIRG